MNYEIPYSQDLNQIMIEDEETEENDNDKGTEEWNKYLYKYGIIGNQEKSEKRHNLCGELWIIPVNIWKESRYMWEMRIEFETEQWQINGHKPDWKRSLKSNDSEK